MLTAELSELQKEEKRRIRHITVMASEHGQEKEGTSFWIEKTDLTGKWAVYDSCEEDIQSDGDMTKDLFENYEDALEFARSEADAMKKTYVGIGWTVKITEE